MPNVSRELIIKGFMEKAKKEIVGPRSGFDSGFQSASILINCWIAFEAFTCLRYNIDGVQQRINKFVEEFSEDYKKHFPKSPDELRRAIIGLMNYSVLDMRPSHQQDLPIKIEDGKDLEQVFEVIYRVRCNLFHGGKDMQEVRDIELVHYSGIVLYYVLEKILGNLDYLS